MAMTRVVWKYPLSLGVSTFELPKGAELLHAAMQDGELMLWVLVDPEEREKVLRTIQVAGTGHTLGGFDKFDIEHVSTVQDGVWVWHVFQRRER